MEEIDYVSVFLISQSCTKCYSFHQESCAEDIITTIAKELGIGPVARCLFGLRFLNSGQWINYNVRRIEKSNNEFEFRLRFKLPALSKLKALDLTAYDYYFHQVRWDVLNKKVPDISYSKCKSELFGLGVVDMYRVMLETGVTREKVESDYKKYIPKDIIKHHRFHVKKPIQNALTNIMANKNNSDAWFVKKAWLEQVDIMAPNYLVEQYTALIDEAGELRPIIIQMDPYHKQIHGVSFKYDGRNEWQHLCTVSDLCYISVRGDSSVEVCRKSGIPVYLKFHSVAAMFSFVSLLDGYYRLGVKWTFNLCKDLACPSLRRLYALKCHGPIRGEYSYSKLEFKRDNKPGCFILRESEIAYNCYYIDVCTSRSTKPTTYKIEERAGGIFWFSGDNCEYDSIPQLIASHRSLKCDIPLVECIPPSEYDESQLLVCRDEEGEVQESSSSDAKEPKVVNPKHLQVFKGRKIDSKNGRTMLYPCVWQPQKNRKVDVVMKVLKSEHRNDHLEELLELGGHWAVLQSNAVVRLLGVTLTSPVSLVMEYLAFGPLDVYLRQQGMAVVKEVDLVEAAAYLATALWHLEEKGLAHGKIRCHKLLVAEHSSDAFTVRLSDPGLQSTCALDEVHWIPPEYYEHFDQSRSSLFADVWAFGTTLWEIFSYGAIPSVPSNDIEYYKHGGRLNIPLECSYDVYQLMLDCWHLDPYHRKKPQEAMRDIKWIHYQVYNSRRTHSYATVLTPRSEIGTKVEPIDDSFDTASISSATSVETLLTLEQSSWAESWLLNRSNDSCVGGEAMSPDISALFTLNMADKVSTSMGSVTSLQEIFELNTECNVVLQGRIGQGFYGEVYKGTLEYLNKEAEPQVVAVKKLKADAIGTCLDDFEREISIMKRLNHPNIVMIKDVIQEPEVSLVMEFVAHGSLQSYLKIHSDRLEMKHLLKFARGIAEGMEYLGKKDIVHRDLAARNVLVASEDHVKISDFGLAQVIGPNSYYVLKTTRELPIKWYAPESLRSGHFSVRSDVWSYGVTLWEMFSWGAEPTWPGGSCEQRGLLQALERGCRLPCPAHCPAHVYAQLIAPCWQLDSRLRHTFADVIQEIAALPF